LNGGQVKVGFERDPDGEELLRFVRSSPIATFFHSPAWLEVLEESFPDFECGWLVARRDEELAGLMPVSRIRRRPFFYLHSMPFGTYGHPLAVGEGTGDALMDAFFDEASAFRCLEAEANLFYGGIPGDIPRGWKVRSEECSVISIEEGFEEYRSSGMSRKRRQLCNRCEREGVEARLLSPERDLDEFYSVYLQSASRWGGLHPYPRRFFESLFSKREQGVLVWGAFVKGRLEASHVDFYFGNTAQAWQAAVSKGAYDLDLAAFLIMNAVREGIGRGVRLFNLGSSGGDRGMIFFKESMGGRPVEYPVVEKRGSLLRWIRRR